VFKIVLIVGGVWINAEILNIPWSEKLIDPNTRQFMVAKSIIETEVMLQKYDNFI
jgi:hypothetical protein